MAAPKTSMKKTIWIVEGLGSDNPMKHEVGDTETVGDMINEYSRRFGVRAGEIEVSTDTTRLTNEKALLKDVVDDGDTVNIIPRAKAGNQ